jgi:hypothetical protein
MDLHSRSPLAPGCRATVLAVLFLAAACPTATAQSTSSLSFAGSGEIVLSTPSLVPAGDGHRFAAFSISWPHSWRETNGMDNLDAAWLFLKHRHLSNGLTGEWRHATLSPRAGDHSAQGASPAVFLPDADGRGLFLLRGDVGAGSVAWSNVLLRWNATRDGVAPTSAVEARLFALPMCLVPAGPFDLGDGRAGPAPGNVGGFHRGDSPQQPFRVDGSPIRFEPTAQGLWADATREALPGGAPGPSPWGDPIPPFPPFPTNYAAPSGTLQTNYPTGFHAFFVMKTIVLDNIGYNLDGYGFRGGDFYTPSSRLLASARTDATVGGKRRLFGLGFRGVRSAPAIPPAAISKSRPPSPANVPIKPSAAREPLPE